MYILMPVCFQTNIGKISAEQIARNVFNDTFRQLRGYVQGFNNAKGKRIRKKEIELLGIFRGVVFPEIGEVLHSHRIGCIGKKLPLHFRISRGDVVIEKLKSSFGSEYEEVKRFPLCSLTLELKVAKSEVHGNDFLITAFCQNGAVQT